MQPNSISTDHRLRTARLGEDIGARWLLQKGYTVLEQNWRSGRQEIDLIALDQNQVVFVEVKTRRESTREPPTRPEEAVDSHKQRQMLLAARAYLRSRHYSGDIRFDVLAIRLRGGKVFVWHQPDAFFPGS